jgi:hypothetical protein
VRHRPADYARGDAVIVLAPASLLNDVRDRRPRRDRRTRPCAVLSLLILAAVFAPRSTRAEDGWGDGHQFGLSEAAAKEADSRVVASIMGPPAQVAGSTADDTSSQWHFSLAPYVWTPRTTMTLGVGPVSRSTTIDFIDILPQLHFAAAGHFEATYDAWTGFLDLYYYSVGKSETRNGVSVSTGLQNGFFEFGGTYRLGPVSLGNAGHLTFEPLVGARFIWVHASLGFPNQKPTGSGNVLDPMVGGRVTYHITDTVALWFRGDAAGFGISDDQTHLTYNLLGGVEWRFSKPASAIVGWRYMNIDGPHQRRINQDLELNGPFMAVNFHF